MPISELASRGAQSGAMPSHVVAEIIQRTRVVAISLLFAPSGDTQFMLNGNLCKDSQNDHQHARAFGSAHRCGILPIGPCSGLGGGSSRYVGADFLDRSSRRLPVRHGASDVHPRVNSHRISSALAACGTALSSPEPTNTNERDDS